MKDYGSLIAYLQKVKIAAISSSQELSYIGKQLIPKCWWSFGSRTWVTDAKVLSWLSTPTELSVHLKFPRFKFSNNNTLHKKLEIKGENVQKLLSYKKICISIKIITVRWKLDQLIMRHSTSCYGMRMNVNGKLSSAHKITMVK